LTSPRAELIAMARRRRRIGREGCAEQDERGAKRNRM
jgi:hypothetical protein